MNDEIKEMLKDLEYASGVFDYTITPDRCTLLLDYITNLQKENQDLKRMCELYGQSLYNVDLKKYKSRIDKAIEYIEENVAMYAFNNKKNPHWEFNDDNIEELLKILQGDSNE